VENYIRNPALTHEIFPADVKAIDKHLGVFNAFREHPNGERYTELMVCTNREWEWQAYPIREKVWLTMILDAVKVGGAWGNGFKGQDDVIPSQDVVDIAEWKTGKPKDEHAEQRNLYALGGLIRWKQHDVVRVTTYYLDGKGEPQRLTVKRTALDKLKDKWEQRVDTMQSDQLLAPRPGYYCRWCHYSKEKGGPCKIA
jgi:hypothetical protein